MPGHMSFPEAVNMLTGMPIAIARRAYGLSDLFYHRPSPYELGTREHYRSKFDAIADGFDGAVGVGVDVAAFYLMQEFCVAFDDRPQSFDDVMGWLAEWHRERSGS